MAHLTEMPTALSSAISRLALPSSSILRDGVRRLAAGYRNDRKTGIRDELDVLAYIAYRMPATYAAAMAVLARCATALPGFEPRSLIDVGAGPGTAAWAALEVFPTIDDVCFVEQDARMRSVGEELAAEHTVLGCGQWINVISGQADLVVASYAFGEMPSSMDAVWAGTRDVLVVVEPGTPDGYGTVLDARRRAIRAGACVAAPCPHDGECPLRAPDWCHFSQRLSRSTLHRSLKDASLPWEDEKYSYVVLRRGAVQRAAARVIGRPRFGKRIARLPLCTHKGLTTRVVPRSDPMYGAARKMRWGDACE